MKKKKIERVLAIASGGGHWVQLQRLRPAWDGCQVYYVTTESGYFRQVMRDAEKRSQLAPEFFVVTDANRWQKVRLIRQMVEVFYLVLRLRPNVVISTGASPGFFALKFAKLIGAKTIWVDSIANVDELSLSGLKVKSSSDMWLTQWKHLSKRGESDCEVPEYKGSVI